MRARAIGSRACSHSRHAAQHRHKRLRSKAPSPNVVDLFSSTLAISSRIAVESSLRVLAAMLGGDTVATRHYP
jgi:hypothetical protein